MTVSLGRIGHVCMTACSAGSIPTPWGSGLETLSSLDLSQNRLTGQHPDKSIEAHGGETASCKGSLIGVIWRLLLHASITPYKLCAGALATGWASMLQLNLSYNALTGAAPMQTHQCSLQERRCDAHASMQDDEHILGHSPVSICQSVQAHCHPSGLT